MSKEARKFAVIFGVKYGLTDKIGKTEAAIRKAYGDLYHPKVMDALIADMKSNDEIKKGRNEKPEEGGE